MTNAWLAWTRRAASGSTAPTSARSTPTTRSETPICRHATSESHGGGGCTSELAMRGSFPTACEPERGVRRTATQQAWTSHTDNRQRGALLPQDAPRAQDASRVEDALDLAHQRD